MKRFLVTVIFLVSMPMATVRQADAQTVGDNRPSSQANPNDELAIAVKREAEASKLLYSDGNYDEALANYEQVLRIREHALGPDHVYLAATLMDIALCYRARGDYVNADEAYKRALGLREKTLGATHPEVARTLERYSCLMRRRGRNEEAAALKARGSSILLKDMHKAGPVTGTVVEGKGLSLPQPLYPKYVRKQHLSGSVMVNVTIGEGGTVIDACAIDGPPSLALVSEGAALHALFTPTTLDGVPVKVSGAVRYNFVAK